MVFLPEGQSPPPIIASLRGDDFFTQAERQSHRRIRQRVEVPGFPGEGQGFSQTIEKPRSARFERQFIRSDRGIRGRRERPMDFELRALVSPQSELTTDSVIEAVGSLGEVAESLGGQNFSNQAELVSSRREAKGILEDQIKSFSEGVENLTIKELNPQRLKQLSKLDFSGSELAALKPLTDGLSERQLDNLRKDVRELTQSINSIDFDLAKIEQGFEDFLEKPDGKKLAAALLVAAGVIGAAALTLGTKDKRVKAITVGLALVMIFNCCGPESKVIATETGTATANTPAAAETAVSPTPEIADIVETPAAATETAGFIPPNNPPIYQETGTGGPLPETNPLSAGFNRSRYVLLAHEGVMIDQSQYSSYEELVKAINQQAKSRNIDVIQAVSHDGEQTLSVAVRTYADGKRMFIWLADADSNLLGARADIPPSNDSIEGEVSIPKEFKDFQLKVLSGEDNNFYLYLVGSDGKAIAWFWPTSGYVDEGSSDNAVVNGWHWVDADGVAQFDKKVIFGEGGAQVIDEAGNVLLNFDLAQKAWVEALPPLPSEFLSQAIILGYSQEYLQSNYITGKVDIIQIGDLTYPALVGIKKDGTSETLGLKLNVGYGLGEMLVPLDDEEVNNLAQQLDCSLYPGCIYWAHFGGEEDFPSVLFISTGIIKTLDLTPLGLHGILVDVELGITKTTSGNPRFLLGIVQKRNADNPDVNLIPFCTNYLMNRFQDMENTEVYTIEELAHEMPKGKSLMFGLEDYDIFSSANEYLAALTKFIETHAEAQLEGLPMIYPRFIQDYLP